ncbi:unnamed protein product [Zymoseptoria tritici ST99CH_3D1]|nr:unnamed protein product [Zymoseptoria tritici ST99CH_3D1]
MSQTLRMSGRPPIFHKEPRCIRQLAAWSPPQLPSAGMIDPFNRSPVHYHPWYDQIMHHMMVIYAPLGWAPLKLTNDQGFEWEWYMTQTTLAEPAFFMFAYYLALECWSSWVPFHSHTQATSMPSQSEPYRRRCKTQSGRLRMRTYWPLEG